MWVKVQHCQLLNDPVNRLKVLAGTDKAEYLMVITAGKEIFYLINDSDDGFV